MYDKWSLEILYSRFDDEKFQKDFVKFFKKSDNYVKRL